jgi:hypothetical protein
VWRTGYLPTIVFTFSAMQTHSRLLPTPHASLELHPKFDTWESIWSAQDVVLDMDSAMRLSRLENAATPITTADNSQPQINFPHWLTI